MPNEDGSDFPRRSKRRAEAMTPPGMTIPAWPFTTLGGTLRNDVATNQSSDHSREKNERPWVVQQWSAGWFESGSEVALEMAQKWLSMWFRSSCRGGSECFWDGSRVVAGVVQQRTSGAHHSFREHRRGRSDLPLSDRPGPTVRVVLEVVRKWSSVWFSWWFRSGCRGGSGVVVRVVQEWFGSGCPSGCRGGSGVVPEVVRKWLSEWFSGWFGVVAGVTQGWV